MQKIDIKIKNNSLKANKKILITFYDKADLKLLQQYLP